MQCEYYNKDYSRCAEKATVILASPITGERIGPRGKDTVVFGYKERRCCRTHADVVVKKGNIELTPEQLADARVA